MKTKCLRKTKRAHNKKFIFGLYAETHCFLILRLLCFTNFFLKKKTKGIRNSVQTKNPSKLYCIDDTDHGDNDTQEKAKKKELRNYHTMILQKEKESEPAIFLCVVLGAIQIICDAKI